VQSLDVLMPVPGLKAKYSSTETPKESLPSSGMTSPNGWNVPEAVADFSMRNPNTKNRIQSDNTTNIIKDNLPEQQQRDSNVEYPHHGRSTSCVPLNDRYPLHVSNKEYPHDSIISDSLLNNCSVGEETSGPITISYHQPPTEIIEAAGYSNSVQNSLHNNEEDEEEVNALELPKSATRRCELPTISDQHVLFHQLPDANKCTDKLDDSLPIPILRAASPVIPAVRTGQAPSRNEVMCKLESKWQVWYMCILILPSLLAHFVRNVGFIVTSFEVLFGRIYSSMMAM
jgi:hypothetical protein